MADRDLNASDQAFGAVLASLQREVRLLRSRAARPGAVRYDIKDAAVGLTSQTSNQELTLNEMRLDPGMWAIFARARMTVDRSVLTGTEVFHAYLTLIAPSGEPTQMTVTAASPIMTPTSAIGYGVYSTMLANWTVHQSDDVFTVLHQGNVGDWTGSTHTVVWEQAALMALPM